MIVVVVVVITIHDNDKVCIVTQVRYLQEEVWVVAHFPQLHDNVVKPTRFLNIFVLDTPVTIYKHKNIWFYGNTEYFATIMYMLGRIMV